MKALLSLVVGLGLLPGCASTINLEVLQPAALAVPPNVNTLAVIDRSRAKNAGQGLLGAIEGALSGEAIGVDTEGRAAARQGLAQAIAMSPRFDVVTPSLNRRTAQSSLFSDAGLDWGLARRICRQEGCDGIVTLEAFDSDTFDDVDTRRRTEEVDGKKRVITEWDVERRMNVLTAWRLYDVANQQILDDMRETTFVRSWTGTGETKRQAFANLPSQVVMVRDVAFGAGDAYGRRIAPSYITVSRRYFARGDDRLKDSRNAVRGLQWDRAADLWEAVAASTDEPKTKGRATFNLALYHEVRGDLQSAFETAQTAHQILDKGVSRRYVNTLAFRLAEADRLEEQMR